MAAEAAPESAEHERTATSRSPETVDRILVGFCGAIWLVLLAAGVVAAVAMVRLASGQSSGDEGYSSWLLYSIIVVSALIIIGAIPLLLRARRTALAEPAAVEPATSAEVCPVRPVDAPTEKIRVFGVDPYATHEPEAAPTAPAVPAAVLDRLWLRGTTSLLSAMGLALTAVAVGTNFLAAENDTGAWVALGLAGVITIAMPAILVFHQRMLNEVVEEAGE
jgi:hypothetical protein